jgi:putative addiction module component (TIGR02574 family)
MDAASHQLLQTALTLSDRDRADLATQLIASLDPAIDSDSESAWSDEVQKRLSLLDNGTIQTIPWRPAREQIAVSERMA